MHASTGPKPTGQKPVGPIEVQAICQRPETLGRNFAIDAGPGEGKAEGEGLGFSVSSKKAVVLRLQTGVHAGRVQRPVRGQFEEAHNQEAEEKRESQNALRQPTEPGHPAALKRRLSVCMACARRGGAWGGLLTYPASGERVG